MKENLNNLALNHEHNIFYCEQHRDFCLRLDEYHPVPGRRDQNLVPVTLYSAHNWRYTHWRHTIRSSRRCICSTLWTSIDVLSVSYQPVYYQSVYYQPEKSALLENGWINLRPSPSRV